MFTDNRSQSIAAIDERSKPPDRTSKCVSVMGVQSKAGSCIASDTANRSVNRGCHQRVRDFDDEMVPQVPTLFTSNSSKSTAVVDVQRVCHQRVRDFDDDTAQYAPSSFTNISTKSTVAVDTQSKSPDGMHKCISVIRVPSRDERRIATDMNISSAFGVKGALPGVYLSLNEAVRKANSQPIKEFSNYETLWRNIKAAKAWVKQSVNEQKLEHQQAHEHEQEDVCQKTNSHEQLHHQKLEKNLKQSSSCSYLSPRACKSHPEWSCKGQRDRVTKALDESRKEQCIDPKILLQWDPGGRPVKIVKPSTSVWTGRLEVDHSPSCHGVNGPTIVTMPQDSTPFELLDLSSMLRHRQVSHVRSASANVKQRMDSFRCCSPGRMHLDLRGRSASRIQKDLRKALVQDLLDGDDTAAFVCRQLGIDNIPRADQLELMIAAMPGRWQIKFEGVTAESDLDIEEWMKGHATHCSKCSPTKIADDCYFKVVHHFLLRGFDPALKPGRSWESFVSKNPAREAYVDAWRQQEGKCKKAWDKWENEAAGLLSAESKTKPNLVVPLLPATRAKQVWRFHRDGTPYKVRLCLDLTAAEVNDATQDWHFRYRNFEDIAENIRKGDWLASVDISRFYLRLPAGQGLRQVQWVQVPSTYGETSASNVSQSGKKWRQLQAIGFGLKTAPAWASVVSSELVRILEAAGIRIVGCYLDDLLIAGETQEVCQRNLDKTLQIMKRLGIPANEKTVQPQAPEKGIVFLGVHVRTADMRFTVSEEHRKYAIDRISHVLESGQTTKGELASISGVLSWISFVYVPGKSRRQHIYDAAGLGATGKKSDIVQIIGPLRRQLSWWRHSLSRGGFVGTRIWDSQASPSTCLMHSDASGEDGWGACIMNLHVAGPWPVELADNSMLFKELLPVAVTLSLVAPQLTETVFGVAVDNTGAAFATNKMSCSDRLSCRLLQEISAALERMGHTALATHVRRHRNQHADDLSHALFQVQWDKIMKQQKPRKSRVDASSWFFPFVAQCTISGRCSTGVFRMRKSLFSSKKAVEQTQP